VDIIIISSNITCCRHDIAATLLIWRLTTINHLILADFCITRRPLLF